jgi:ATP-binding cassette subfamily B protein
MKAAVLRRLRAFAGVNLRVLGEAFRTFKPTLADQRGRIVLAFLLVLLIAGLEVFRPWPLKWVVDRLFSHVKRGKVRDDVVYPEEALEHEQVILAAVAAVFGASLLLGRLGVVQAGLVAEIGRKAVVRVRKMVFSRLTRLGLGFHLSHRTGDLLTRLSGDVVLVRDLLLTSWLGLAGRFAVFFGTTAALWFIDWKIALVAIAPFPFLMIAVRGKAGKLSIVVRKQRRQEGDVLGYAAEALRNIRVVKAYAAEDRVTKAYVRDARSGERKGAEGAKLAASMGEAAEFLTGLGLAVVLWYGAHRALDREITAGELVLVLTYARTLYKPFRGIAKEGGRLSKAVASADRLLDVLRRPGEDVAAGEPAPAFRGEVAFDDVAAGYGGRLAVDGVDLRIGAGELAVFAGPNGAGKTTTVNLLLRLLEAERGAVTVDGVPIGAYRLDSYRERLAYVPQEIALFGGTIEDNVLFGRPDADDAAVQEALEAAFAADFVAALPEGVETRLGENGMSLSGGEARRLMLARAAVRDARILVLDEPFAGLDPESRVTVAKAIRRLAAGRTAIVVTHVAVDFLDPDVVFTFEGGRVADVERRTSAETRA